MRRRKRNLWRISQKKKRLSKKKNLKNPNFLRKLKVWRRSSCMVQKQWNKL